MFQTVTEYYQYTARETLARRSGEERRRASADAVATWGELERRATNRREENAQRANDRIADWFDRYNAAKG